MASADGPIQRVWSPPGLKVWKPGAADAVSTHRAQEVTGHSPESYLLQKGDVQGEWASVDYVAVRAGMEWLAGHLFRVSPAVCDARNTSKLNTFFPSS